MRELPRQLGALGVQGSLESGVSDSDPNLHLPASLFHIVQRQPLGATVGVSMVAATVPSV